MLRKKWLEFIDHILNNGNDPDEATENGDHSYNNVSASDWVIAYVTSTKVECDIKMSAVCSILEQSTRWYLC